MVSSTTHPHSTPAHDAPRLDGLRAIAATLVVLTHSGFLSGQYYNGQVGAFLARSDVGVPIFFALSGFLLSRSWARKEPGRPGLRRYFRHRFWRIAPAYWVALVAVLLTTAHGTDFAAIASNFSLTQVYSNDLLPSFTQTWSLCAEVAFYLALPLIAPWALASDAVNPFRSSIKRCLVLCLVAWTWLGFFTLVGAGNTAGALTQWAPGHLDWFAAGIILARFEPQVRTRLQALPRGSILAHPGTLMLGAIALFWLAMTPLAGPRDLSTPSVFSALTREILYAAIAGLSVLAALTDASADTWWGRTLQSPFMKWAAEMSYAVFLWHLLVLQGLRNLFGFADFTGNWFFLAVLTLIVSAAIAQLSVWLVERPSMRIARRGDPQRKNQPSQQAAATQ